MLSVLSSSGPKLDCEFLSISHAGNCDRETDGRTEEQAERWITGQTDGGMRQTNGMAERQKEGEADKQTDG